MDSLDKLNPFKILKIIPYLLVQISCKNLEITYSSLLRKKYKKMITGKAFLLFLQVQALPAKDNTKSWSS